MFFDLEMAGKMTKRSQFADGCFDQMACQKR
jgi:hypothetical protein